MRGTTFAIGWIALLLLSLAVPICAQLQPLHDGADSNAQEPVDGVYRVGHGVSAPRATYAPDPEYADKARQAGYEGTCVMTLVVDAEGMPQDIKVTRPLGMGLDEKALKAVRQWRFTPSTKDGTPVAVQIAVEVKFHLYGGEYDKKLFQKANSGDAKAQLEMAQILLSDPDLAKDDSQGFGFLEKAAKQKLPPAQFAMGEYFSSHKNDLVSAYVWYAVAQRHHYKDSDKRMKELAEKMTPEQSAEARGRVESSPF